MQVVWQYHVEEPVSAAGVLPDHGAVRGSRPLYLVQRDTQPRRSSRNQEAEPPLRTWDILNKQVSVVFVVLAVARANRRKTDRRNRVVFVLEHGSVLTSSLVFVCYDNPISENF